LLLPYVAVKERAEGISKPMIIASTTPLNRVELWVLAQKRLGLRGQFRVSYKQPRNVPWETCEKRPQLVDSLSGQILPASSLGLNDHRPRSGSNQEVRPAIRVYPRFCPSLCPKVALFR